MKTGGATCANSVRLEPPPPRTDRWLMAFLNRKIRAAYAGALGACGLVVGAALDPLSSRSDDGRVTVAPVSLTAAASRVPVERQIEGKTIEWWRARAVENRRTINRLRLQAAAQASARP